MYTKTFEGNTMEEALNQIKLELGPDAIILKTKTNKGPLALNKKKIEIIAAIKEKDYLKKSKVDSVLSSDQKSSLYQGPQQAISSLIDQYDQNAKKSQRVESGYGQLGQNKTVQTKKTTMNALDDFLGSNLNNSIKENNTHFESQNQRPKVNQVNTNYTKVQEQQLHQNQQVNQMEATNRQDQKRSEQSHGQLIKVTEEIIKHLEMQEEEVETTKSKMNFLEKQLF